MTMRTIVAQVIRKILLRTNEAIWVMYPLGIVFSILTIPFLLYCTIIRPIAIIALLATVIATIPVHINFVYVTESLPKQIRIQRTKISEI